MNKKSNIFIAAEKKFYGYHLNKFLKSNSYLNLIYDNEINLDLKNYNKLNIFFKKNKIEYVFFIGGKSAGIQENICNPASLMLDNLKLITNIISLSSIHNVKKLIYLSSSCTYPKNAKNPLKPEYINCGDLEKTNQPYAITKLAGMNLCSSIKKEFNRNFISVIPSTIYGPNDDFISDNSHVLTSLIKKIYNAKIKKLKSITLWGSGNPVRDFIFVEDLVKALVFCMRKYNSDKPLNISSNESVTIKRLSNIVKEIIQYEGKIYFDKSKEDGVKIKTLDVSEVNKLGWKSENTLAQGIIKTYNWYKNNYNKVHQSI